MLKTLNTVLALATLISSTAITLPTNGVYHSQLNADGTRNTTKLASTPALISRNPASALQIRADSFIKQTYCGCGFNVNPTNTDAALAMLHDVLITDPVITGGGAYLALYGDVVAFICNYNAYDLKNLWFGDNIYNAVSYVTIACGKYVAGTVDPGQWRLATGYMRSDDGWPGACEHAITSPVHRC